MIEFCVDFIDDMSPIGLPVSRHEGRLRGKGTLGKKARMDMDAELYDKAHYTVLKQSSLVSPYLEESSVSACEVTVTVSDEAKDIVAA